MKENVFRVIIAGGRDFNDYPLLKQKCDTFLANKAKNNKIVIVSGTAKGADRLGERYARERGYQVVRYPANWDRDGNSAGPIRNAKMAENADALIAFWDGNSRGTYNMIDLAANKEDMLIRVVNYAEIYMKRKQNQILQQTIQYAKEHITGKGMHTGIKWFQDAFSDYCKEYGEPTLWEFKSGLFSKENFDKILKHEPEIREIAHKDPSLRTAEDTEKVRDFISRNFAMEPEEIDERDIEDVLELCDAQAPRDIAAEAICEECAKHFNKNQMEKLQEILEDAVKNSQENNLKI